MINIFDKNGIKKELAEITDLNTRQPFHYHDFTSQSEILDTLKKYPGYSIYGTLQTDIEFAGYTFPTWSKIFFPYSTGGDTIGFCIYPDPNYGIYVLGIVNGTILNAVKL